MKLGALVRDLLVIGLIVVWFVTISRRYDGDPPDSAFLTLVIASAIGDTIIAPLEVLIHELGHGIAVTALTGGRTYIVVGQTGSGVGLSLGRIDVLVGAGGGGGRCELPHSYTRRQLAIIAAAGPFASALVTAAATWAYFRADGHSLQIQVIFLVAAFIAASGVANLVPTTFEPRYAGAQLLPLRSDGLLLWSALTGRGFEQRQPPPSPLNRALESTSPATRAVLGAAVRMTPDKDAPVTPAEVLRALASSDASRFLTGIVPAPDRPPAPTDPPRTLSNEVVRSIDRAAGYRTLRGDAVVEPVHLLLGLLAEPGANLPGIDRDGVRAKVLAHLA